MSQGSPPKKPRFFIDQLLENVPVQNNDNQHRFLIRNLLSNNDQDNSIQVGMGVNEKYIEKLGSIKTYCKRFKLMKVVSKFAIKAVTNNPEDIIRIIFNECINEAICAAREEGVEADHLGATISSPLLDSDIWIPIRTIREDTVENILQRFFLVSQSKADRGSLMGEPFTVSVDTIDVSSLQKEKQIKGRATTIETSSLESRNDNTECWLIQIRNFSDNYCLFYALELTKKYIIKELGHNRNFGRYHRDQLEKQQNDILNLIKEADIPLYESSYDAKIYVPKVVDYWNKKYLRNGYRFKVFVFGDRCENKPKYVYGSDNFNTAIPIYYSNEHFDGIRTVGAQFGPHWNYCYTCQKKYRRASEHDRKCKSLCHLCGRVGLERPCLISNNFRKECKDCGKLFWNSDCFKYHNTNNNCLRSKQCEKCGIIWNIRNLHKDPSKKHICGHKWCFNCLQYHSSERGCFISPLKEKKKTSYRLVTFDFESTQHTTHPEQQTYRLHNVNFVAATITCTKCMESEQQWKSFLKLKNKICNICGKNRNITFSTRAFYQSKVDEQRITNDPLRDFVNWILFELDNKYTTIAFSHFGGRYDMIMTFREIFMKGIVPTMIRRGNKLYELRVQKTHRCCEIIFRDSYNLCPVALNQLVGAFDLQVQEKQFFPHLANNPKNYDITLPKLPPKEEYLYGSMLPDKQKAFDRWYIQEKDKPFCLNEALAEYCLNDVQILTEALLAFRSKFLEISKQKNDNQSYGIDILQDAMTIASACMKHFRLNHLKPEQLAIVPEKGYDTCDNQSEIAMKYLDWYAEKNNVEIRTSHSEGGEHTVAGRYKVDGYIEMEDRAIEVHGCVWHACPRHYGSRPDFVLPNGKTVEVVRKEDDARLEILRQNVRHVDVIWECEIKEMLRRNRKMRRSFANYIDKGPINLRDCFFGGRTGPLCLHYEADNQHKISYLDFNSLYPSTIATTSFPVGHPRVIIIPRSQQDVNWTSGDQIPVRGILKVFLIPPLYTEVPVMPVKFDERLLFPLCRQCSLDFPRGGIISDYSCPHDDNKRGWVSTCTSIELEEALNNGYKVTKYFRALHYDKWDGELFKGYVSEFMSMKIHASGFPKGIDMLEKEEKFIKECKERFGIHIEKEKMVPDKAMRYISKLMLNSLWGRFSLRNTLTKCHITDSPAELRNFLENKSIEVNSVDKLTENTILINYATKNEFIEEHQTSNIVISLWTTSAARIKLLKAMQTISRCSGCSLLYGDTDSVLFSYPINKECPLSSGYHLGELAEEYENYNIKEYVGAACKAYGLKMLEKETGKEKTMLKVRGITLTSDICKKLNYTTFKNSVIDFGKITEENQNHEVSNENDVIIVEYPNFIRPSVKTGIVCSVPITKTFKPIILKGIVTRNLKIVDFGFKLN